MTNDLVDRLRQCWASKKLQKEAADLIEQLQRERDEARDRLAEAEREHPELINVGVHQAVEQARREGFRAGIEAAAEKAQIFMLGLSKERSDKMQKAILALTPTDKPAAPSVVEAAGEGPYTCRSCCAATWNDSDVCDDCALAAREDKP